MVGLVFKPGARRPQAGVRLVPNIDPMRTSVCVCVCVFVCVSAPEAINN